MPDTNNFSTAERLPSGALLHYAALLTGFGTAFLGPSLPALTAALHLSDSGDGTLLAAQFTGAFLGGWTTRSPLHRCMQRGYTAAFSGFALLAGALAWHAATAWAVGALLLLGFGIGQLITSNNLLAAMRWAQRRGAALTFLNFTWSAGALSAPLFIPALLRHSGTSLLFGGVAILLGLGFLANGLLPATASPADGTASAEATRETGAGLSRSSYLYFCLLLFLYGGVETSLSGWLTFYDQRYGVGTSTVAASAAAFWFCLTGARALFSALLLRLPERLFLRGGLLLAVATLVGLLLAGHGSVITLLAGVTGAALAPWFPLVFSGLVAEQPLAKQAGRVVAVSGLGAAALPWLVGQVSGHSGSLRTGLVLPIAATLALVGLSFRRPPARLKHGTP